MSQFDPYKYLSSKLTDSRVEGFATVLSVILSEAEELFGPKIQPYPFMLTGVDFGSDSPQIRYRDGRRPKYKYIIVRLSRTCRNDDKRALWQLVHECVHLLSPDGQPRSSMSVLEEGIACWYQRHWVENCPKLFPEWAQSPGHGYDNTQTSYNEAADFVSHILRMDPTCIKRVRVKQPIINKISAIDLLNTIPTLEKELARQLVSKFRIRK